MNVSLDQNAIMPEKAHQFDAGYDLFASEPYEMKQNFPCIIQTGVHMEIPPGYAGFVKDRSSKAKIGLYTHGGVIDSGYTGPIGVMMTNTLNESLKIERGDKIAQIVISPVAHFDLNLVEELEETERGSGGFGSSGSKKV